jgi:uncharacterized membrane protein YedE/YeeE
MTPFTPWTATAGGLLIGGAATLLLVANGRLAGISGILGGALGGAAGDRLWRVCFLLGLPLGALAMGVARGGLEIRISASPMALVVAGLLVGFGTQLGGGCTSGHGVCGVARGSRRSLVATVVFMLAGALTVYWVRHGMAGS